MRCRRRLPFVACEVAYNGCGLSLSGGTATVEGGMRWQVGDEQMPYLIYPQATGTRPRVRGGLHAPVSWLRSLQHRPFTHPMLHQIFAYLRRPLHGHMMLIGEVGRPGVYDRALLDRLPHRRRKAPLTRLATPRTDLDLGAMRGHFDPDGGNVANLALFAVPLKSPCAW